MTKIALALNVADPTLAWEWFGRIEKKVDCYKLQMDLFGRSGPDLIRRFVAGGAEVFLDLKFHDIPSVVGASVRAAGEMGATLLTVHTSGGAKMMAEAAKASATFGASRPLVLGVTVLTSLDEAELERVTGCRQSVSDRVMALARLAKESGCDGIVCSPYEIGVVKEACGKDFVVVTPGIRFGTRGQGSGTGAEVRTPIPSPQSLTPVRDDQARTLTPAEAAKAGADYIVVGRPIYEAPDPVAAIAEIREQLRVSS
jgi:orotidine-5'-phosphate decarboxylase